MGDEQKKESKPPEECTWCDVLGDFCGEMSVTDDDVKFCKEIEEKARRGELNPEEFAKTLVDKFGEEKVDKIVDKLFNLNVVESNG